MKKIIFLAVSMFLLSSAYATVYDKLYLQGSATTAGWTINGAIEMTKIEDGVFTWTGPLKGNFLFRFYVTLGSWFPNISCQKAIDEDVTMIPGEEMYLYERESASDEFENNFYVEEDALYTINVNLNTMIMVCTKDLGMVDITQLYLIGAELGTLNNAIEMTEKSEGVFTWTGYLEAEKWFKFQNVKNGTWLKTIHPSNATTYFEIGTEYSLIYYPMGPPSGGDYNFMATTAGDYLITVDLNAMTAVISQPDPHTGIIPAKINELPYKIKTGDKTVSIATEGSNVIQTAAIYDATGKCLNFISHPKTFAILGENLADGLYIIKIQSEGKESAQKIIIK
ncbi:MAG: SusF/SusE family outer membrane protein [Dysgonamonadaceae bacterium]|jgi:hypothetical protein|nr:SusF/SusE family outer membrane protein [Dysgonamonadaceae bacterium]